MITPDADGFCRFNDWAAMWEPDKKPIQKSLYDHFDISKCDAALIGEVVSRLGKSTAQAA